MKSTSNLAQRVEHVWTRISMYLPLLILVISLLITFLLWQFEHQNLERELRTEFTSLQKEARDNVVLRIKGYQQMLEGVNALFAHAKRLERKEFHDYIATLKLETEYPGIQGIDFVLIIPAEQKNRHITTVRQEGFPDYTIHPEGKRNIYTSTVYFEPFNQHNSPMLGYDAFTDPIARAAMEQARDSGMATLSGKTASPHAGHEVKEGQRDGMCIYLPVYQHGKPITTVAERRANISGWITSHFQMERMMAGILGEHTNMLDLEIFDGPEKTEENLLYDPDMRPVQGRSPALFEDSQQITIANHIWTMEVSSLPAFESGEKQEKQWIVAYTGTVVSLLLALLSWLLMFNQKRSKQIAAIEAGYNAMFGNTLDAALLLRGDRIMNCNTMATSLLGRSRSEILGQPLIYFSPPTQPDGTPSKLKISEEFSSHLSSGEQDIFEWQFRHADGSPIYCDVALRTITLGGELRAFISLRDITQRKQAELVQLHSILESSPDAVLLIEADGRISFANRVAEKTFYYPITKLVGLNVETLVPAHARQHHDKLRLKFEQTPHSRTMASGLTLSGVRSDGVEFPVEISLSPIKVTGKDMVIAVVHDITARKRAEEKLRNSLEEVQNAHQRLSLQFNLMPQAYIVWDRDFSVTEWNPAAERMFGWTVSEAVGRHAYELIVPTDVQEQVNTVWKNVLHGDDMNLHSINENITRDGQRITCEWFNTPLRDSAGKVQGCMSMVSDITQRKQAEKELIELNERLEHRVAERTQELEMAKEFAESASHAKSEFLANMSHEIRTPMNSVLGMTYLALTTDLTAKQRDYLEKIHSSGEHLLAIINDILDFSKIEAGKLSTESIDFELNSIFKHIENLVAEKAKAKGLRLTFDSAPELPSCLRGDPLRISQILINYVNNAIKFTHQGEIHVRVKKEGDGEPMLRFEVQDSGIGMSQEEISQLFRPFHQADGSTTRKYGGTGLGLAISKRLAHLMGGEAGVASQPGLGSTFWFTTQLASCSAPAACCTTGNSGDITQKLRRFAQPSSAIHGSRILLADDNLFNQQVACELLQDVGAYVVTANNGAEALDCLSKENFDCVLMDVQMPVMDGLEATRRIRADKTLAGILVIAMTANARTEDKQQCIAAGMNDFITKPISPALFYSILDQWLSSLARPADASSQQCVKASTPPPSAGRTNTPDLFIESMLAGDPNIIDLSVLAKMMNDDPAKIRKFAHKFLETADKGMAEIEDALARADLVALAAVGHRIKSAARTVGAMGFSTLCQTLEQHDGSFDLEQASDIINRQKALLELIREQIKQYMA